MTGSFNSKRRRQLTIALALLGVVVAVGFGLYFNASPQLDSQTAIKVETTSVFFCPGSLLFVGFIDAEPQTGAFLFMWLLVAAINFFIYGAIGLFIGRLIWKSGELKS